MGWFLVNGLEVDAFFRAAKGADHAFYILQLAVRDGDAVSDACTAQPFPLQEDLDGFLFAFQPAVLNQDGDELLQDTLLVSGGEFPDDGVFVQYIRYLHGLTLIRPTLSAASSGALSCPCAFCSGA